MNACMVACFVVDGGPTLMSSCNSTIDCFASRFGRSNLQRCVGDTRYVGGPADAEVTPPLGCHGTTRHDVRATVICGGPGSPESGVREWLDMN